MRHLSKILNKWLVLQSHVLNILYGLENTPLWNVRMPIRSMIDGTNDEKYDTSIRVFFIFITTKATANFTQHN
jgi:hypothetical protein